MTPKPTYWSARIAEMRQHGDAGLVLTIRSDLATMAAALLTLQWRRADRPFALSLRSNDAGGFTIPARLRSLEVNAQVTVTAECVADLPDFAAIQRLMRLPVVVQVQDLEPEDGLPERMRK